MDRAARRGQKMSNIILSRKISPHFYPSSVGEMDGFTQTGTSKHLVFYVFVVTSPLLYESSSSSSGLTCAGTLFFKRRIRRTPFARRCIHTCSFIRLTCANSPCLISDHPIVMWRRTKITPSSLSASQHKRSIDHEMATRRIAESVGLRRSHARFPRVTA